MMYNLIHTYFLSFLIGKENKRLKKLQVVCAQDILIKIVWIGVKFVRLHPIITIVKKKKFNKT